MQHSDSHPDSWFATWFDSPFYHLLYSHRNEQEAEAFIERLLHEIQLPKNAYVLDLACGKGRHAQVIHKLGYHVTGLDLSPNSIGEARKRLPQNSAEFYIHDMRQPFRINYYDAVLNLFTSFGYFDHQADEIKTLQAMRQALKPQGKLIIDYLNAEKVRNELPKTGTKKVNDIIFSWETKEKQGFVVKNIHVEDHGKNYQFMEKVRLISAPEFSAMLEAQGLNIIHTFGNYLLQDFMPLESERLIIVAQAKI